MTCSQGTFFSWLRLASVTCLVSVPASPSFPAEWATYYECEMLQNDGMKVTFFLEDTRAHTEGCDYGYGRSGGDSMGCLKLLEAAIEPGLYLVDAGTPGFFAMRSNGEAVIAGARFLHYDPKNSTLPVDEDASETPGSDARERAGSWLAHTYFGTCEDKS